jgi:hypothetical protein
MGALDRTLARAVARAGAPGRIRFTRRQLYYELCRVLLPLPRLPRGVPFTVPPPIGYQRYLTVLHRHGPVAGLIDERTPVPGREPSGAGGTTHRDDVPDLYDYGLPRLLVCQDASIASMLLANDLHMESACPVFTVADLPLDPRLDTALRRTAGAVVHVLHDASGPGLATVEQVRRWAGDLRVRPLGLRPAHARSLHLTTTPDDTAPRYVDDLVVDGLQPWELRWLRSGRSVETAAVNPARLLRTVHRLVRGHSRARPRGDRLRQLRAAGFMTWPTG